MQTLGNEASGYFDSLIPAPLPNSRPECLKHSSNHFLPKPNWVSQFCCRRVDCEAMILVIYFLQKRDNHDDGLVASETEPVGMITLLFTMGVIKTSFEWTTENF